MARPRKRRITHMTRTEAFEHLDSVARGLALTLGPTCEALVQEITDGAVCTVLSIYNGQVSGRSVGSTLSIYGADTRDDIGNLMDLADAADDDSSVCMEAVTATGRRVKSSSWILRGHGYVLLLGINMDVTTLSLVGDVISGLASVNGDLRANLNGQVQSSEPSGVIDECLSALGRPAETLDRAGRVELVRLLSERGFFEYHKSVALLAERLGVSKNTVYNYLREVD
jgi:predicted transcriptional regulator YheO